MSRAAGFLFVFALLAGCYGPGIMGWGMNGTSFEVEKEEGFVEVTAVGRGPMKAVSEGASPEYMDEPSQWEDFDLQFEVGGVHASFNAPATNTSKAIPAATPWPLTNLATGPVHLGDRLFFCHERADLEQYRFAALMGDGPEQAHYNIWFDRLPKCG